MKRYGLRRPCPFYISYDGTGVPMTPEELRGRRGKQADGSAKTREAKLGCVLPRRPQTPRDFLCVIPVQPASLGRLSLPRTSGGESMEKRSPGFTQSATGGSLGGQRRVDQTSGSDALPRGNVDYRSLPRAATYLGVMQNPLCQE